LEILPGGYCLAKHKGAVRQRILGFGAYFREEDGAPPMPTPRRLVMGGPMMRTSKREDHAALTRRSDSGDAMGRAAAIPSKFKIAVPIMLQQPRKISRLPARLLGVRATCCADISAG